MIDSIQFNDLTKEQIKETFDKAYIFNITKEGLSNIKIPENKFDTEDMGGCAECVDIFVDIGDNFIERLVNIETLLKKKDFFTQELDSGSGYYLLSAILSFIDARNIQYRGVLVITRTLSNYAMDRKTNNISGIYFHLCPNEVSSFLEKHPEISGWVARKRLELTENYIEELKNCFDRDYKTGKLSDFQYDIYKKLLESDEK
jgi:hypothetical protein